MGTFVIMSPSPNIGGTCYVSPCPIWIDAPANVSTQLSLKLDSPLHGIMAAPHYVSSGSIFADCEWKFTKLDYTDETL